MLSLPHNNTLLRLAPEKQSLRDNLSHNELRRDVVGLCIDLLQTRTFISVFTILTCHETFVKAENNLPSFTSLL